ncbi:hypothetical protein O181_121685 [Austropuccinia psidii MF-1]|uniref:Uncharacterized protein n=1 Tax=Austropuccinia psidii MF-1 TaxID=1389203 RepID=A0A9Q3KI03_9BASI|nr:hypothetical protein [Austropuccinia psidii MF-1]
MPVQAANAPHANHYNCTSSQQFKNLAMAVQAPDTSHGIPNVLQVPHNLTVFLRGCRNPIVDTPILTLVQVPDNSNISLCRCRLWKIHMRMLRLVQVPTIHT